MPCDILGRHLTSETTPPPSLFLLSVAVQGNLFCSASKVKFQKGNNAMCVPVWWHDENPPFTVVENTSKHIKETIIDSTGHVTDEKVTITPLAEFSLEIHWL